MGRRPAGAELGPGARRSNACISYAHCMPQPYHEHARMLRSSNCLTKPTQQINRRRGLMDGSLNMFRPCCVAHGVVLVGFAPSRLLASGPRKFAGEPGPPHFAGDAQQIFCNMNMQKRAMHWDEHAFDRWRSCFEFTDWQRARSRHNVRITAAQSAHSNVPN